MASGIFIYNWKTKALSESVAERFLPSNTSSYWTHFVNNSFEEAPVKIPSGLPHVYQRLFVIMENVEQ